jgi:hypothetical protein
VLPDGELASPADPGSGGIGVGAGDSPCRHVRGPRFRTLSATAYVPALCTSSRIPRARRVSGAGEYGEVPATIEICCAGHWPGHREQSPARKMNETS